MLFISLLLFFYPPRFIENWNSLPSGHFDMATATGRFLTLITYNVDDKEFHGSRVRCTEYRQQCSDTNWAWSYVWKQNRNASNNVTELKANSTALKKNAENCSKGQQDLWMGVWRGKDTEDITPTFPLNVAERICYGFVHSLFVYKY